MKEYTNVMIEVLELKEDVICTSGGDVNSESSNDYDDIIDASDFRS